MIKFHHTYMAHIIENKLAQTRVSAIALVSPRHIHGFLQCDVCTGLHNVFVRQLRCCLVCRAFEFWLSSNQINHASRHFARPFRKLPIFNTNDPLSKNCIDMDSQLKIFGHPPINCIIFYSLN